MPDLTFTETAAVYAEFNSALRIDQIEELENARSDLGDLTDITASIAAHGVQQPITVYLEGTGYILWTGGRRFEASKRAGKTTIPAIIAPKPTPQEFLAKQVVENLIREDMSEQDIFLSCVKLKGMGMLLKDIAASLGRSTGTVSRYFAPEDCPEKAREYFLARKLSLGQMYTISQSPEPLETMRLLLGGATREEVVKKARKPKANTVRSSKPLKCALPNGAVVTVAADDISLEDALESLGEATKALKAAIAKGLNIRTAVRYWADIAAAGN